MGTVSAQWWACPVAPTHYLPRYPEAVRKERGGGEASLRIGLSEPRRTLCDETPPAPRARLFGGAACHAHSEAGFTPTRRRLADVGCPSH